MGLISACVIIKLLNEGKGYSDDSAEAYVCFAIASFLFWPLLVVVGLVMLLYKLVSRIIDIFIQKTE